MPELGRLYAQLQPQANLLFMDAVAAILPAARNAEAHEDFLWDGERRLLLVGDDSVSLEELQAATTRAQAFMDGCECAWRCARASSPTFASLLDIEDPAAGLRSINHRSALAYFGTNGLLVRTSRLESETFEVELEQLPFRSINPCFQAIMWASRYLSGVQRFVVSIPGRSLSVMDLSRTALDGTLVVWAQARATFSSMPPSTFLPATACARLAVESPAKAADAAAWLALNDAINAYDGAHEAPGTRSARLLGLSLQLEIVSAALAATMTILPAETTGRLEQALELVRPAAAWAASGARGGTPGPSEELERCINELFDSWPVVSVLPTLDPRPLDVLELSEQN